MDCRVLSTIVGLKYNNPKTDIIASQVWIANHLGYSRTKVNESIKRLHDLGLILKTQRGSRARDRKNTCKYEYGEVLEADMGFLAKHIRRYSQWLRKLFSRIPKLHNIFMILVTSISFLITPTEKLRENRDIITNNSSAQKEDYLKVNEIYEREPTLPVDDEKTCATILSMLPKPNIGDINAEETCVEHNQYTAENVGFLKLLLWGDRTGKVIGLAKYQDSLKGRNTDLAHCDDATYKTLGYEDKKIVDGYTNYRRFGKYKTRVAYEESLIIRGLEGLISYTADLASQLTKIEIKFIKSFTVTAIDSLKQALRIFPRRKTDFEWILEFLTETSGMTVHETRALLRKHGFTGGRLLREAEKQEYVVKRGKSKVWKPEPRTMSKPESPEKYQASDAFTRLIGQDLDEKLKNKFASNSRV